MKKVFDGLGFSPYKPRPWLPKAQRPNGPREEFAGGLDPLSTGRNTRRRSPPNGMSKNQQRLKDPN